MKKDKYLVNESPSEEDWKYILNNSPQSSIFCEKIYLEQLQSNFKRIIFLKGNQIKAGILLLLDETSKNIIENELIIYSGILFVENDQIKKINKFFDNFEIQEFITDYISSRYLNIFLPLSPEISDVRTFLWHKYHTKDKKEKFLIDVRYTSYIDISELNNNDDDFNYVLFKSMHSLRRRHLKKAYKEKHKVNISNNPNKLISFYEDLMIRQGEKIIPSKILVMKNLIIELIDKERGSLIEISDGDEDILYIVFYVWDAKRAYYLFGAGNPAKSEPWQGTLAHWEAFKYLSKKKSLKVLDFEGVNSPKRGWFKLSFGGELITYYHLIRNLS